MLNAFKDILIFQIRSFLFFPSIECMLPKIQIFFLSKYHFETWFIKKQANISDLDYEATGKRNSQK